MGNFCQGFQVIMAAKIWVHLQKVLNAIAETATLKPDLFQSC